MLSRCANPACGAPFRYLKEGAVYIAEWANEGDTCELGNPAGSLNGRWSRREMYWLCSNCNRSLLLIANGGQVLTRPRDGALQNDDRVLRPMKIAV